jgi:GH25 family lysozyme M1 (1,4-beta-N-acetylmuramidase)
MRTRSFAAALSVLVLAGCAGAPGDSTTGSSSGAVTEKCGASPSGAVQGRDVSIYQGNFDWSTSGVSFGYARVSDGLGDVDSEFGNNWSHLAEAHILRGAYQFFEPGEDATAQADLVVQKVGKLTAGDLPAMIDVEVTDGRSPSEMASAIRTWLKVVEAGTGLRPIIYAGSYFWQDNVQDTSFGAYPIWIAAYGTACPSLPPGWSNWTFWQYSDGGGSLDHDVFNGSLAELEALGKGSAAPPTSTPPKLVETAFQANTGNLWTVGTGGDKDWKLGMMDGTSPSIAAVKGGFEVAFEANTTDLWTVGDAGNRDWKLGMMPGTSPSIAALPGGGFQVAFQANTGDLWTVGDAGDRDWKLGMMKGTSPSIAALPGGGFEVAFEANTTDLWTVGDAGNKDWKLGMMPGTSPSIVAIKGGFEVAFEANTTDLWTVGDAGDKAWKLGMMKGTSPSIVAVKSGFEVAFEANTTDLWSVGDAGDKDWKLGMMPGTSPSIAPVAGGGFEVSFEANTTDLWTVGDAGDKDWKLGMMKGTSPSGT